MCRAPGETLTRAENRHVERDVSTGPSCGGTPLEVKLVKRGTEPSACWRVCSSSSRIIMSAQADIDCVEAAGLFQGPTMHSELPRGSQPIIRRLNNLKGSRQRVLG